MASRNLIEQLDLAIQAILADAALPQLDVSVAPLASLAEGLVTNEGSSLRVTEAGRMYVRNVCMAFDRYLEGRQAAGKPVYSRTV